MATRPALAAARRAAGTATDGAGVGSMVGTDPDFRIGPLPAPGYSAAQPAGFGYSFGIATGVASDLLERPCGAGGQMKKFRWLIASGAALTAAIALGLVVTDDGGHRAARPEAACRAGDGDHDGESEAAR